MFVLHHDSAVVFVYDILSKMTLTPEVFPAVPDELLKVVE
jgi:regulator of RNase E activity RraB